MIQDIFPDVYSVAYEVTEPQERDIIIFFEDGMVYLTKEDKFPDYHRDLFPSEKITFQFLFRISGKAYFLGHKDEKICLDFLHKEPARFIRGMREIRDVFAGFCAWHLFSFYRDHKFCGRCGRKMLPGKIERNLICKDCGNIVYPDIHPCIIVAVHDGDRLLMTKYRNRPVDWFVLVAGFIEVGETAEDTVRREVMEETGLRIKNIRYFASQPWGMPGNLTLGYTAELDGDDTITIEEEELCDGRWFQRDEVPVPNDNVSITAVMIRAFVEKKF